MCKWVCVCGGDGKLILDIVYSDSNIWSLSCSIPVVTTVSLLSIYFHENTNLKQWREERATVSTTWWSGPSSKLLILSLHLKPNWSLSWNGTLSNAMGAGEYRFLLMLSCHVLQKKWTEDKLGLDSYLIYSFAMKPILYEADPTAKIEKKKKRKEERKRYVRSKLVTS